MDCMNYQLQFLKKIQKPVQIKGSKIVALWTTKDKNF